MSPQRRLRAIAHLPDVSEDAREACAFTVFSVMAELERAIRLLGCARAISMGAPLRSRSCQLPRPGADSRMGARGSPPAQLFGCQRRLAAGRGADGRGSSSSGSRVLEQVAGSLRCRSPPMILVAIRERGQHHQSGSCGSACEDLCRSPRGRPSSGIIKVHQHDVGLRSSWASATPSAPLPAAPTTSMSATAASSAAPPRAPARGPRRAAPGSCRVAPRVAPWSRDRARTAPRACCPRRGPDPRSCAGRSAIVRPPRARLKAAPVVGDDERRLAALDADAHRDVAGLRVRDRVAYRLLRDAEDERLRPRAAAPVRAVCRRS